MKNINNTIKYNVYLSLGILAVLSFAAMATMPNPASADTAGYVTPYNSTNYNGVYGNDRYNTYQAPNYSAPAPTTNPTPVINFLSPNSTNVGVGTKTVTITGNGFIRSSVARVNGQNRATTFIDSSHLLIQINGSDTFTYYDNGGFYITVMNPAPGGGYSNAVFFTITKIAPASTTGSSATSTTDTNVTNFNDINGAGYGSNASGDTSNLASNAIFGANGFIPSSLIQWVLFAILVLLIVILVRRIYGGSERYHAIPLKHD